VLEVRLFVEVYLMQFGTHYTVGGSRHCKSGRGKGICRSLFLAATSRLWS
jgi:hypothetical protein